MRITESQLRKIVRQEILREAGLSTRFDDMKDLIKKLESLDEGSGRLYGYPDPTGILRYKDAEKALKKSAPKLYAAIDAAGFEIWAVYKDGAIEIGSNWKTEYDDDGNPLEFDSTGHFADLKKLLAKPELNGFERSRANQMLDGIGFTLEKR